MKNTTTKNKKKIEVMSVFGWFSRNGLQALITGNFFFTLSWKNEGKYTGPTFTRIDERRRGNDERKQASITPAIKIKKENYF